MWIALLVLGSLAQIIQAFDFLGIERWVISAIGILLALLAALVSTLKKYSLKGNWLGKLYRNPFPKGFKAEMSFSVSIDGVIKKGKKPAKVFFEIPMWGADMYIIHKTDQAVSRGKLIGINEDGDHDLFVFAYTSEAIDGNLQSATVPKHDGIVTVTMRKGKIFRVNYMNSKPSFGYYSNIQEI